MTLVELVLTGYGLGLVAGVIGWILGRAVGS